MVQNQVGAREGTCKSSLTKHLWGQSQAEDIQVNKKEAVYEVPGEM